MDVALGREPFGPDSREAISWCQRSTEAVVVAWHTVANLFYLLASVRSGSFARSFIEDLISFVEVAAGGNSQVRQALRAGLRDFEDALQVSVGLARNVDLIITRNVRDFRNGAIAAQTPREFLDALASNQ